MVDENRLSKTIEEYQKVAKENKNVDISALMISALKNADRNANTVSGKMKKWAYLVSVGLPPFGLLFAIKFLVFSEEEDAKKVGYTCVILTCFSVALFWLTSKMLFSSSGTSLQQIEQINPQMIQQTLQ